MKNLGCEISRLLRKKERKYLKDKINEHETKSKIEISEICTDA